MPENNSKEHQSSDHRYLQQLEFNPELRKSWLNFFVVNFRVVLLLIILITAWGIFSFNQLPLESNPEVKIPFGVVTTAFPGASPQDVEELVTKKIESNIASVKGIKQVTSSSANSFSVVSVEFDASEDQEESLRRLRDQVAQINDLPDDATEPQVREISFNDQPIFTFSISGPYDGFTLHKYAELIQDELEKVPGAREVNISGGDERQFEVAYDPDKLVTFGLSANAANQAIAATNQAIPSGNFEGREFSYSVRTDARFFDEQQLKNIPVLHTDEGAIVYLKDIAQVRETAIKRTLYSRLSVAGSTSEPAVTIDLVKKTGGSVIDTVDQSRAKIEAVLKTLPEDVKFEVTTDFAEFIRRDFDQLRHDFLLTLILVMGVLFLIVGLKEALVAGLAIPLVFFVTFGVMDMTGITLNFLSLFSLILALGLLVDDAIVVVSATKQYLKSGKFTPEEAVLLVLNDFKIVLTSTTLATTWAFLPLLLSTGIIGSFIRSIPITVSVTLIASLMIALMINHPLAAVLERIRLTKGIFLTLLVVLMAAAGWLFSLHTPMGYALTWIVGVVVMAMVYWLLRRGGWAKLEANKELVEAEWRDDDLIKQKLRSQGSTEDHSFSSRLMHGVVKFDRVIPLYEKLLRMAIGSKKRRVTVIVTTVVLFIGAVMLPVSGIVRSEFFPASDEDNLFINIEAPVGLNLDETNKVVMEVEDRLTHHPEIANFSTIVGKEGTSPSSGGTVLRNSSHLAAIVITLVDKEKREITSYDLATEIRQELSDIPGATAVKVESAQGGPPSGAAFEARVIGEDLQTLDKIANDLKGILSSIDGVVNPATSLKEAPAEYTFKLDPEKMELFNLNAAAVGGTLRMAISSVEVSTVIKDEKEIAVNARFMEDKIDTLEELGNLQIINNRQQPVFLKDVSRIELQPSVDSIGRIDQKRVVRLTAGVDGKTNSNAVIAEFQKKLAEQYQLPEGYSITYGGENEENIESVKSIVRAMVIAAILIVSTLVIQFNSFKKAIIVLVTLPLALIGVFVGMAIFQIPLSFPGLIGILALFGIVVKNAIILIDKINLNIKSGIPYFEAVVDAGKSRLEAIFITSICTVLGIIPITLSNALWMALGSAVIFGLLLSSFLTLYIIPALYISLIGEKERV